MPFFSYGQAKIKEIREINPIYKTLKYSFPLVVIPQNQKIADKINNNLVSDFLDADRTKIKKSIFENVWATKEMPNPTLSDISFKVLSNDRNVLNISIFAQGCGAYCEGFTTYYSYNLKSGARIVLDSLFNEEGIKLLIDSMNKKKKEILSLKLKEIKDTLSTLAVQKDSIDKESHEEMVTLYTECMDKEIKSLGYQQFYITNSSLYVISDRCSAHYNMTIDDLWSFKFTFSLETLKPYFTNYAIRLLKKKFDHLLSLNFVPSNHQNFSTKKFLL